MSRIANRFRIELRPATGASALCGLVLVCLLTVPGGRSSASELYGSKGVRAESVRQGRLGSCYFHAVVSALAQRKPEALQKMIKENRDGTYTVQFPDGVKEIAYPEDLRYSRETGYDLSEGLWVAVIFRGYAQRVLRRAILEAIDKSDLFPLIKQYAKDFISSNDPLLLAYDRAIRAVVDQEGNIDRPKLEARLKEQMKPIPASDEIKDSLVKLLESGGFFEAITESIRQNGELFGAYRAVGQGGIAERVMQTLAGSVRLAINEAEEKTSGALAYAEKVRLPMVACTGGSRYYHEVEAGHPLPGGAASWYVNAHCYTLLGYNEANGTVTLRNPWGAHPDPGGIFSLPLATFVPAFRGIIAAWPER